jgi:glycosyltransferase involved in cell wall biosynthesis
MRIKNVAVGAILLWRDVSTVGTHAWASHLFQRGCNVAWYTAPLSPLHLLSTMGIYNRQHAEAHRQRFAYWREGAHLQEDHGARMTSRVALSAVHPARNIPFLSGPWVLRNYLKWRIPSLQERSLRDGIGPIDTIIFDAGVPEMYYPFADVAQLSIYRVNDMAAEYTNQVRSRVLLEPEIIRKADILFAVYPSLYDEVVRLRGTQRGVHLLPNGFDNTLFGNLQPEPSEYAQIPSPRAVLLGGNFGNWYDWDLLLSLFTLCPDVSFCVIGRRGIPTDLPRNVFVLGTKPHEAIPGYLQHAQVGLIPYQDLPRIRRVERPLKFYEYLASGLPIVSVPWGALKTMAPFAVFGSNAKEFAEAITQVVSVTPEERAARRKASEQFSWQEMMKRFEMMLGEEGIWLGTTDATLSRPSL